ncbi:hypothetical protein OGAPHI_006522 [Ogataea philodendri]|uniref:Xylanolytic transcriptional activator regulatory domain-containing protein n=1 Tax=Ogataea philodendri TaxID=1378263 RepID=A0A9P8NY93_9ASCO|nr:uncharacterized protein OGAPHI_006522 [Ogataea philodendri]KAH3661672.1 hypothetical protein OGAPHI_006522 [Ogataea philodendri]
MEACELCSKTNFDCELRYPQAKRSKPSSMSSSPTPSILDYDRIYANAMKNSKNKYQFITTSHPLAPLFSNDSFLALSDGELFNLFFPWRDLFLPQREQYARPLNVDQELLEYVEMKGAFKKAPYQTQRKLVQLYLDNLYPLYPVVDRDIINHLDETPPLLLNAMMMCGVRYDTDLDPDEIRSTAEQLRRKCELLKLCELNKITLIQGFLLMSNQEEAPTGPQVAREYVSRACILIIDLGLHNNAAKNQLSKFASNSPDHSTGSIYFRLSYKVSLLTRLFWTSFCLDRVLCSTSSATMIYSKLDLAVDIFRLDDFDGNLADYEIFMRWYKICDLLERVLVSRYRPPGNRSLDHNLERDIVTLCHQDTESEVGDVIGKAYVCFLKTFSAYCAIMFLRSKVDFICLLEDEIKGQEPVVSDSPLTDNKMYHLSCVSRTIVEQSKGPQVQHIISIHAVLHVIVLLHLEIEARQQVQVPNGSQDPLALLGYKKEMFNDCLRFLERNSKKWFFSAACYHLCEELVSTPAKKIKSSQDLLALLFGNE